VRGKMIEGRANTRPWRLSSCGSCSRDRGGKGQRKSRVTDVGAQSKAHSRCANCARGTFWQGDVKESREAKARERERSRGKREDVWAWRKRERERPRRRKSEPRGNALV
jgi:hypothetical protein